MRKNAKLIGQRIQDRLSTTEGFAGYTVKLEIGSGTVYFRYCFIKKLLCYVDMTISKIDCNEDVQHLQPSEQARFTQSEVSKLDNNRALVEMVCKQSTELLQRGVWNISSLARAWRATHFEPAGLCRQMSGFVSSPLDAAARWLIMKGYVLNE